MDLYSKYKRAIELSMVKAVEAGIDYAVKAVQKRVKEGKSDDGTMFTNYKPSHKSRRKRAGLQTSYKDLNYSGTMMKSIKEIGRVVNDFSVRITYSFTGSAHKRADQKSRTNKQIAGYLGSYEKKPILGLTKDEEKKVKQIVLEKMKQEIIITVS